jgi:hypothetical protein
MSQIGEVLEKTVMNILVPVKCCEIIEYLYS